MSDHKSIVAVLIVIAIILFDNKSMAAEPAVYVVKGTVVNQDLVKYSLVDVVNDKEVDAFRKELEGPIELLSCSSKKVVYLDENGQIISVAISDSSTNMLWSLGGAAQEPMKGKLIVDSGFLYVARNSHPEEVVVKNNRYSLDRISGDGSKEQLVSGEGKVYAIWKPDMYTIEMITGDKLVQIDLRDKSTRYISPFDVNHLKSMLYVKHGRSLYVDKVRIYAKNGVFGEEVFSREFHDGFSLVVDNMTNPEAYLVIDIAGGGKGNDLFSIRQKFGAASLIYKADVIADACYVE